MNKVFVTGLSINHDFNSCGPCNFDFEWLLRYPAVLLWADKILVSKATWNFIQEATYPDPDELAKSIKLIFQIAAEKDMIEIVDPTEVLSKEFDQLIINQIETDIPLLLKTFPEHVSLRDDEKDDSHTFLKIAGIDYCFPQISAVYTSLTLARFWNANCLFDSSSFNLLRFKFGISGPPKEGDIGFMQAFSSIFNTKLPNELQLPKYAFNQDNKCSKCKNDKSCKKSYLGKLEKDTKDFLKWRDFDEILQMREVLSSIIQNKLLIGDAIDPEDVALEFEAVQSKYYKMITSLFPRISRWANISTIVSTPLVVAGLAVQNPILTVTGATLAGISKITEESIKILTSKHRWVTFKPDEVDQCS